ncbi:MAG TPA: hypothetical protein VGR37_03495 [Longimicrobiaceae bacterium]|nr:hypothetical protein [Longimicrobiaceae bacterium]
MLRSLIALPLALAFVAGCQDANSGRVVGPSAPPSLSMSGEQVFSVALDGLNTVKKEGRVTVTATPSGGVAPYYYYWYEEICDDICYPPSFLSSQSGWGANSASVWISSMDSKKVVTVQVLDSQGAYATGSQAHEILGPASFQMGSGGITNFCGGTPNWYPFRDSTGDYARNTCNGSKMRPPSV